MNKTYTFHEDPGHGWLQIPMADLFALGIPDCISSYSYFRGTDAYLEDLDASTFMASAKAAGWQVTLRREYADPTPIRDYRGYPSSPEWEANLKTRSAAA